jgi:HD-GYP domain-containing protein (c-di-GMP phosphodiesterase class II)
MSSKIQISSKDVQLGMYIVDLDRPWLETPFLFQGFVVEDEGMIQELQQYCSNVYIIENRFDDSIAKRHATSAQRPCNENSPVSERLRPAKMRDDADEELKEATRDLTLELGMAREAHSRAQQTLDNVFARLRAGQSIDIRTIQKVVAPMVESIYRNDDALAWLARMKKKNDYVYDHSMASAVWAMIFAKHLNLERQDVETIGLGAMLMDVGKTRIPDELLAKQDELSAAEMSRSARVCRWIRSSSISSSSTMSATTAPAIRAGSRAIGFRCSHGSPASSTASMR